MASSPAARPRRVGLRLTAPKEADPLEAWHQETLVRACALHADRAPDLLELFAVPNGGFRSKATAAALQRQGVKPGVPDLALDLPRRGYHGLRIELKRFRSGSVEEAQKQRLSRLHQEGYRAVVCWGWRAAWDELLWYLDAEHVRLENERPRSRVVSTSPYLVRKESP